MPMFTARQLCPGDDPAANMAKYVAVSREVRTLMGQLTPLVEPLSIDEAFLDLSGTAACTAPRRPGAGALRAHRETRSASPCRWG